MPGRETANGFRYGFNGKENDNEVTSTGIATQDYGMRIYNPGLARFLSVDPLSYNYSFYSPYHFAGNKPIVAVDLDGLEDTWIHYIRQEDGSLFLKHYKVEIMLDEREQNAKRFDRQILIQGGNLITVENPSSKTVEFWYMRVIPVVAQQSKSFAAQVTELETDLTGSWSNYGELERSGPFHSGEIGVYNAPNS